VDLLARLDGQADSAFLGTDIEASRSRAENSGLTIASPSLKLYESLSFSDCGKSYQ